MTDALIHPDYCLMQHTVTDHETFILLITSYISDQRHITIIRAMIS